MTFEELVTPLIKYMAENHGPHNILIIDSTSAEILSGTQTVYTEQFIKG